MEVRGQYRVNPITDVVSAEGLAERVDLYRADACRKLDSEQRSKMGQFFTPPLVARFMASLFGDSVEEIRLLDAGAGVRLLTAAFVKEICQRDARPRDISVIACELEQEHGVQFVGKVLGPTFTAGVEMLRGGLFPQGQGTNAGIELRLAGCRSSAA